jgi:hypothetical protein
VRAAQLRDRVVAVLDEDAVVQLLGLGGADLVDRRAGLPLVELVEEEPSQRLLRARVPSEERALHDLGQVDDREDGPVDVGEVAREDRALLGREVFDDVRVGHGAEPNTHP